MRQSMNDYVGGTCEAVSNAHNFVYLWFRTNGEPCRQCGFNPANCDWHQQLARTRRQLSQSYMREKIPRDPVEISNR